MIAKGGLGISAFGFSTVKCGRHGVAFCVGVWEEVGDVDGELGAEEESEEC